MDAPSEGGAIQPLMTDVQINFGDGVHTYYQQTAVKALTSQGLRALGTLVATWDPANSDLTVHSARIIRDGQSMDLLAAGRDFRVLQRETRLSASTLDGRLTAALEVPDLRIGDTLVFAISITQRPPVAGVRAEGWMSLPPLKLPRLHYRATWPSALPMQWRATAGIEGVRVVADGDRMELVYDGRDVETPIAPANAPGRFDTLGELELTAWNSWGDIAEVFTPLFERAAVLEPNSPLREEARKIREQYSTDMERAAAALRLVEEDVRYLAILLGEGALTPASADDTWRERFGDCKAKTVLLVALLRELGIKADPILVNALNGDAVSVYLPRVSAFNHVIVRAEVGGKTYWLDGTRTGERSLLNLSAPDFGSGLLLARGETGLTVIPREQVDRPTQETFVHLDASDLTKSELPVEVTTLYRGEWAAAIESVAASGSSAEVQTFFKEVVEETYPWITAGDAEWGYVEADDLFRVHVKGVAASLGASPLSRFRMAGSAYSYGEVERTEEDQGDKDAPFAINFPNWSVATTTVRLPSNGQAFGLTGADVDVTLGGTEVKRTSTVADGAATVVMSVKEMAPEVSAADAKAASERFEELPSAQYVVLSPRGPTVAAAAGSAPNVRDVIRALSAADDELDARISAEPEDAASWATRSSNRSRAGDTRGAVSDIREARRLAPENPSYRRMEYVALVEAAEFEAALTSAEGITEPGSNRPASLPALRTAPLIGLGRYDEAVAALDQVLPDAFIADLGEPADHIVMVGESLPRDKRAAFIAYLDGRPASAGARLIKGMIQEETNQRQAIVQYDQAVRLAPTAAYLRQRRLNSNVSLSDWSAALVDLDWLIEEGYRFHNQRASVRQRVGDHPGAIDDYGRAIRDNPQNAMAHNNRCWARATANLELESALQDCEQALTINPESGPAYDSRALVYLRLNQYERAIADYDSSLGLREYAGSFYGRGLAKLKLGDREGGRADIARATRLQATVAAEFERYGLRP